MSLIEYNFGRATSHRSGMLPLFLATQKQNLNRAEELRNSENITYTSALVPWVTHKHIQA